ncbi:MAG: phosphatidate cytidylyltransferase [Gammaproteobacteria bacterium]
MSAVPPPSPPAGLHARLLTAAVLIPIFLAVWSAGSLPGSAVFFGAFVLLAAHEWGALHGWARTPRLLFVSTVAVLCIVGTLPAVQIAIARPLFLFAGGWWVAVAVMLVQVQRGHDPWPTGAPAWAMLGLLALIPCYIALVWLQVHDRWALLALFVLVWSADTAAYFAGKRYGVRRLASRLSPGKSWTGAFAAVGTGFAIGAASAWLPGPGSRSVAALAVAGGIVVVVSIFGDLFESLVKRRSGVKDSGTLLPGHGGVLDRIDSLLAAAPCYALALTWMAD